MWLWWCSLQVMSNPLQPCGLQSTRLLCRSDFPAKNISSSKESSQSRDWTHISCTAGGFFTAEPSGKSFLSIYFQPVSVLISKILFFLSEFWGYVLFSLLSVSALKFTDSFVGSFVYDKLLSMAVITIKVIDFWQFNYCVSQHGFIWIIKSEVLYTPRIFMSTSSPNLEDFLTLLLWISFLVLSLSVFSF